MRRVRRRPSPVRMRSFANPKSIPRGREGMTSELARLEHLRTLVEAELYVWTEKRRDARGRLRCALSRLQTIYEQLEFDAHGQDDGAPGVRQTKRRSNSDERRSRATTPGRRLTAQD